MHTYIQYAPVGQSIHKAGPVIFLKVPDLQRMHTEGTASVKSKVQPISHTQLAFPLRFVSTEVVPRSQLKQESERGRQQERGGGR